MSRDFDGDADCFVGVANSREENGFMSQAAFVNALMGPYGLHAVLGLILALFAGFLYVFNFTSFF